MTAPCQACGEDPDLGAMCPVAGLRHVPASVGTCEHVIFDAGPVCSVRCARPVGHPGGHAVQWNEDDQRAVEAWQRTRGAVPPSPEEMAKGAGYYAEGAPADAPMLLVRRDLFIAGILAERFRSAAELAALRTRENWLDGEVGRLRAALEEAQAAPSAMKGRCAKVAEDFRVRADSGVPLVDVDDWPDAIARQIRALT